MRKLFAAAIAALLCLTPAWAQNVPSSVITYGSAPGAACTAFGTTATTCTAGNDSRLTSHTRQVFLSGTSQTYTTPANVRQIWVRMKGGGGGGAGGNGTSGGAGGDTIFNSVNAKGGGLGNANGTPGAGGTGGTGTASIRVAGASGSMWQINIIGATYFMTGGQGGGQGSGYGTIGGVGIAGIANSGGGGAGGGYTGTTSFSSLNSLFFGTGAGEGEYAELLITSPAASYTYTVGAGGSAGAAGSSGFNGAAGGSGYIIVDEFY